MENGNGVMSKSYVVTDGEYSSYHILAVFDNEKLAEKFIKSFGGDIEVYSTNPHEPLLNKGYKAYSVTINIANSHCNVESMAGSHYDYRQLNKVYYYEGKKQLEIILWAKDEMHAMKIASEKRAQFIAKMGWVTE